jgi:4-hydroxy-tetrahydrodipicolinate reductase
VTSVSSVIPVAVVGAGGRMGQECCRAVLADPGTELVAAVDASRAGADLRQMVGGDAPDIEVAGTLEALEEAGARVAIEFTVADATRQHLAWYAAHGVHAVIGTTGLDTQDLAEARRLFTSSTANAIVAANFAIGAVLLMRFSELAAPFMEGVEIIELHHDAKADAPSGTALRTAERIAGARSNAGSGRWPADPTTDLLLDGARGGAGPDGIRLHSVRLPGLVAHQEVIFGASGQSLTLRHDSYDRRSFMPGVLLAVRAVAGRPGLTVGLEALLGL